MQAKPLNKWYRGRHSFISVHTRGDQESRDLLDGQKLFDFFHSGNVATLRLGLDRILVELAILKSDQIIQKTDCTLIELLVKEVITIAGKS